MLIPFFLICLSSFIIENHKEIVWVDNFSSDISDTWRGRYKDWEDYYYLAKDGDESYLKAKSMDSDCFIAKEITIDLVEYPYLNWKWKVDVLPKGGNESIKSKCDVPASLAVVLNKSRIMPKSIKYSWSSTLPEGTITKSPFAIWPSRCDVVVLRQGESDQSAWVHEKVNVLEDYKRLYGKKKLHSKKIYLIVLLTDSDNTGQAAEAGYDEIYFSTK